MILSQPAFLFSLFSLFRTNLCEINKENCSSSLLSSTLNQLVSKLQHFQLPPHQSPSVGLPPPPLAPPRPLLPALSPLSSTSMRSSSGHNGDHMLKPNTETQHRTSTSNKTCCQRWRPGSAKRSETISQSSHRHAVNSSPRSPADRRPREIQFYDESSEACLAL